MTQLRRAVKSLVTAALAATLWSFQFAVADAGKGGNWVIHWERGRIASGKKDYETAVKEISKAIELSPVQSKDQFVDRGDAYYGQSNYEQAIADYMHAVQLSKQNAAEIMGADHGSRTRTFDLAPIYQKLAAAYSALAAKSTEIK